MNICKDCKKETKGFGKRCHSCAKKGKLNKNFKGGKPRCIKCETLLSNYINKLCQKCYCETLKGRGNPRSGVKLSEGLKDKIRKSVLKNPRISKFTERYLIIHNYSSILCSGKYQKVREKILQRDKHLCQLCGKNRGLVIHHIKDKNKYWELFFEFTNLITLCRNCHSYLHKTGKIKNKFKTKLFKILLQEIK